VPTEPGSPQFQKLIEYDVQANLLYAMRSLFLFHWGAVQYVQGVETGNCLLGGVVMPKD